MERDNYDDLLAVEGLDEYEDFYDDYDDFEDDNEDALDELYEALMDANEGEELDEDAEDYDERLFGKRRRRRARRPTRPMVNFIPRPKSKKKAGCCINPKVSQALVALKRKDIVHDRKIRDVDARSRKNLRVNHLQTKGIGKLNKQMSLDGALEFADSITMTDNGMEINLASILKGLIKTGMLGDTKGALGNPAVIGGIGLLLNNPGILGGILAPKP
ncbi:hypothetical protein R50072_08310 [Simiduia litorea]|uniref:hypothetical protein n=1 Tax=Simiduia litorea TaxID=1435348 RepID=UPI0036F1D310